MKRPFFDVLDSQEVMIAARSVKPCTGRPKYARESSLEIEIEELQAICPDLEKVPTTDTGNSERLKRLRST